MAFDQNLQEQFDSTAEVSLRQKLKSVSDAKTSENLNGYFDCNICLDTARDPVVTLCGHLYCWPCIYKWLHAVRSSLDSDKQPDCRVCKARISETSLVPLYGRGDTHPDPDAKQPHLDLPLPRRPPGVRAEMMPQEQSQSSPFEPQQQPFDPQQYFSHPLANYAPVPPNFVTAAGMVSPTAGMFGEMVYARIFGSSDTSLFSYPHASYCPLVHRGGQTAGLARIRRQELQVDKSLSRVSMFLLCCLILCLLLF
ncbi:E3 ubiquitin-protein ligase RMA1H1-like [Apium graveolens]|uniref:E3 ubiquitin-protein ligase RMA1H1-like n=1 Tax=Apium graveolens TaxID=4045 RepID=UPI003D7A4CF5